MEEPPKCKVQCLRLTISVKYDKVKVGWNEVLGGCTSSLLRNQCMGNQCMGTTPFSIGCDWCDDRFTSSVFEATFGIFPLTLVFNGCYNNKQQCIKKKTPIFIKLYHHVHVALLHLGPPYFLPAPLYFYIFFPANFQPQRPGSIHVPSRTAGGAKGPCNI